ncbi:MAG: transposase [Bacteroides sp.]|nr:transposase [Bacteroides sp.]
MKYSEDFKLRLVIEYYSSGVSRGFIQRKYGLSSKTLFGSWLLRYPFEEILLSLPPDEQAFIMKKKESDSSSSLSRQEELEARVKELEKALAYANLRAHALDRMIDIAEEQEGIRIRKKPGTKQ